MFPIDSKIKKTVYTFLSFAMVEIVSFLYLAIQIGYKRIEEKEKSAVAITGMFVLVVFVIAFGKVYYQKSAQNSVKKPIKDRMGIYENANFVLWISLFVCFIASSYLYAVRQDMSYLGIAAACILYHLFSYPSIEKYGNDFARKS